MYASKPGPCSLKSCSTRVCQDSDMVLVRSTVNRAWKQAFGYPFLLGGEYVPAPGRMPLRRHTREPPGGLFLGNDPGGLPKCALEFSPLPCFRPCPTSRPTRLS